MKVKIVAFALAIFGVATIGLVQLSASASQPGQVGSAPRCTVTAIGERAEAFTVNGNKATVDFKVTGASNCRVQVSTMSFYAPSMSGKPYDQQTVFDRNTKTYSPGKYSLSVNVPTTSKLSQGCYYQLDLTYSDHIVSPVLAYEHGAIDACGPQPSANCQTLTQEKISDTRRKYQATATLKNGATVKSYTFVTTRNGKQFDKKIVTTQNKTANYTLDTTAAGNYTVKVTIQTSVGPQSGDQCAKSFTVKKADQPGVSIEKYVNTNQKYQRVDVNVEYSYLIKVTNTGDVALKNVEITDTPDQGITLLSVSPDVGDIKDNTWTYTIPSLAVGQTLTYTMTAKVPEYLAGKLTNTVCVDATEVEGNPDDCDSAEVDVPPVPGKIEVCELATSTIITIEETAFDETKHSKDFDDCKAPEALPETGPIETAMQIVGAMSLVGASAYYITSRKFIA